MPTISTDASVSPLRHRTQHALLASCMGRAFCTSFKRRWQSDLPKQEAPEGRNLYAMLEAGFHSARGSAAG